MDPNSREVTSLFHRAMIGTLLFVALLLAGLSTAHAAGSELVPSVGMQRAVHTDNNEVKPFYGVALRTTLNPAMKAELGVAYRQDEVTADDLKVRSWPVTASLWLTPVQSLYLGGGVGWYNTSLDFSDASGIRDRTRQDFGVHLGGGLELPLTPGLGVDLNGRYTFLPKENSDLPPKDWDPSVWTTTVGLALRF